MTRRSIVGLAAAIAMAAATQATAQTSGAAKPTAAVKVLKPLTLKSTRNLDFGNITIDTLVVPDIVSVTTSGRTCGTSGRLTCSGTANTARYQVSGSNNQVVLIGVATPTVIMSNGAGGTLTMTPVLPPSVTLDNSGNPGAAFEVGGRIAILPTTAEGRYTGTIDVTVIYQ